MVLKYETPQVTRACANCVFYVTTLLDMAGGECRISRPFLPRDGTRRVWPFVFKEDWCGEFCARKEEVDHEQRLMEIMGAKQRVDS